jgi:FMN reductase
MTKPLIVGLGGSMRERSYSRMGLETALGMCEKHGAETCLLDVRQLALPMYVPDVPLEYFPEAERIQEFLDYHRRADAFIWSSATYHGTVTGVIKNALDFLEFLEDDERPYLTGRAVGLISVNDGPPIEHMRTICRELRAWVSPSSVVISKVDFAEDGTLQTPRALRKMERIVLELINFTAKMKA